MHLNAQIKNAILNKYIFFAFNFFIIFSLALIIFRNFLQPSWPAGGDALGIVSRAYLLNEFRWLYTWRPYSFGFYENINMYDLFLAGIYYLCNDPILMAKLFLFISFLISGMTIYGFTYNYSHNNLASSAASLIYTLNPWIFSQLTEAHGDIIFSYSLAPLLFLLADKWLEKMELKYTLLFSIFLAACITSFHMHCLYIYMMFLTLFISINFIDLILIKKYFSNITTKKIIKIILPLIITTILLSAFWVIPLILNLKAQYLSTKFAYPLEETYGSRYSSFKDAFLLKAVEKGGYINIIDISEGIVFPDLPIDHLQLFIYILSYLMILIKKDRYTIFFLISSLISTFLSKGSNPPFGNIFIWLWFNLPYFSTFRAVSRWSMMTAFSHAFYVSFLVSLLCNYIQKKKYLKILNFLSKLNGQKNIDIIEIELSELVKYFGVFLLRFEKFLYYFGKVIIVIVIISAPLSIYFFFTQGLQVYDLPQDYIMPYSWLSQQPDDFKIITVNRSPGEWKELPGAETDFSFNGMLIDIGWVHDIGFDSSFIHNKPTLQDGGWELLPRTFTDHLRFRLAREYITDNLLKIIGTFNYKYIVIPPYASENIRNFFLNQKGYKVIYNRNGSLILENLFFAPRFFTTTSQILIIGGLESFSSLSKVDDLKFNSTAMIFAHQLDKIDLKSEVFDAIVFVNSDILDLAMLSLKGYGAIINAEDFGFPSQNFEKYWVPTSSWSKIGGFTLNINVLTTFGKNKIEIPYYVNSDGTYTVWIRVGFTGHRGKLSIFIDHTLIGQIIPQAYYWSGLKWIKLSNIDLKRGSHIITLENDGTGYNDVDTIAIIKDEILDSKIQELINNIKNVNSRIIYIYEAENIFTFNPFPGWSLSSKPYEGFFLSSRGYLNLSPEGKASASSSGTWETTLWPNLANDGNLETRWSSKAHEPMPQWLMIEWDKPKAIKGVRIFFERAYAKNYIIQTWNGTSWIDKIFIENNTMLDRIHIFEEAVETTKIRIYITSIPEIYANVSLWEFEVFEYLPALSTEIYIPKDGNYGFILRVIDAESTAIPYIRVDEKTIPLRQLNTTEGAQWYQGGPIRLNTGNHTICIGSMTELKLDQLILFSLKEGEKYVKLDELFKAEPSPGVSYAKVSPCEYKVHISNSSGPFILAFSESFHPLWRAYLEDEEISPTPLYLLANGFYIVRKGDFDLTVYFKGQTYTDVGLKISVATLIIVIIFLLIPSKRIEEMVKHVKQKKLIYIRKIKGFSKIIFRC